MVCLSIACPETQRVVFAQLEQPHQVVCRLGIKRVNDKDWVGNKHVIVAPVDAIPPEGRLVQSRTDLEMFLHESFH
jgi:hypothetical protein